MQANWLYPNANQLGQDYNPQTQINASSAKNLGFSWSYPLLVRTTAELPFAGGFSSDSSILIYNGIAYSTQQSGEITAINMATGQKVFAIALPIVANSSVPAMGAGATTLLLRDGNQAFTTATIGTKITVPTYWVSEPDHVVWAMNAATGAIEMNFTDYGACTATSVGTAQPIQVGGGVGSNGFFHVRTGANAVAVCGATEIPGNNPNSVYSPLATNIVIDQKAGVLISSMTGSSSNNSGRCFFEEWNLAAVPVPTVNWINYCSPPQPGSNIPVNPNWDDQQVTAMTGAEIFYPGPAYNAGGNIPGTAVVNLKTIATATLNTTLFNDWGYVQSAHCASEDAGGSPGATGAGWGSQWLLGTGPTAGMVFVSTGTKGPYNGDCQPGPDLWASSVLALNENTGAWVWGFQTSAHDEWGWDCSWWQALANETVSGTATQVLFKTCKNGYLYELNSLTGSMLWAWTPTTSVLARCQYCYILNPLNPTQMTQNFFNPSDATTLMFPSPNTADANEASYDPQTNMIFTTTSNVPMDVTYQQYQTSTYGTGDGQGAISIPATAANLNNATIEGVNAANGTQVWTHFVSTQGFRGGVASSAGVVFAAFSSGDLLMLNEQTGTTIADDYVGGPLNVLPSIGATSATPLSTTGASCTNAQGALISACLPAGTEEIVFPIVSGLITWAPTVGSGGNIVALTLQAPKAGTTTATATATVTQAVTTTVTKISTATAASTLTVNAGTTTTVTAPASTSSVAGPTTTASEATATASVTSTLTTSTGVSSTTLYGIAAVAVIFIIATGYLAMRGRKPPS